MAMGLIPARDPGGRDGGDGGSGVCTEVATRCRAASARPAPLRHAMDARWSFPYRLRQPGVRPPRSEATPARCVRRPAQFRPAHVSGAQHSTARTPGERHASWLSPALSWRIRTSIRNWPSDTTIGCTERHTESDRSARVTNGGQPRRIGRTRRIVVESSATGPGQRNQHPRDEPRNTRGPPRRTPGEQPSPTPAEDRSRRAISEPGREMATCCSPDRVVPGPPRAVVRAGRPPDGAPFAPSGERARSGH